MEKRRAMRVSVIISTYDSPEWLEKVLWGYSVQDHNDFEVLIADDGSREEIRAHIARLRTETGLLIHHIWHEDEGYRRQTILNKAILEAQTPYLIFTDGDCIPRRDFLSVHVKYAEKGRFLSGGYCKLPMQLSKLITREDIIGQRSFNFQWLHRHGLRGSSQRRKLTAGSWGKLIDLTTPANATFNNCNSSAWKTDVLAVNGYDERMQYGGSDREMGERLTNCGITGKQIRHQAIVVHLDHPRTYKTEESLQKNLRIRNEVRQKKISWTPYGIRKDQPAE
jgi:glycosyltransferase involved in cell wall biosynthesis